MPIVSVGPDYLDEEVLCLIKLLGRGGWQSHEVATIERAAQNRSEEVRAGLTSPTARYWTSRIQKEIDDRTRMRRDLKNGWVLDRWASGCWNVVGVLGFHSISEYVAIQCENDGIDYDDLIDYLRVKDMQRWSNPKEYLEYKRARAKRRQTINWGLGNKKLEAIVESMSDRQIKEFITVEQAIKTGEAVTMHGPTLKTFERLRKHTSRNRLPSRAINPNQQFKTLNLSMRRK